ncbi:MAG TPA: serine hydrolase [Candidatus Limnocylindrales bacterium]|nr:serine hydrolase [Candidatus Limnocylindrales bacterium]
MTKLSRRGVLTAGAVATGSLLLPVGGARAAAFPFVAYHGVDGNGHQQRFNELAPQGYRMISLSVYGSPALYAAVWVLRAGPAWAAAHGMTAAGYQAKFNELTALGYKPTIVTATGTRSNPVFAAVFEQINAPVWMARHGLTDGPESVAGTLANANKAAKDSKLILKTLAIYGTGAGDRTYAGVWLPNPGATKWQAHDMGDATSYQNWFNGYTQVYMRPSIVDANDGHQFAALFTDDSVGAWTARHGMTAAEYQTEFNTQVAAGRMPISVHGSGTGSGIRYAAVFAATDIPVARQWTQTNSVGAGYAAIHTVMRNFMQQQGVRAGVLAVRKNSGLVLSSGYTWAEPGYSITQPTSIMRLASVSKAYACAAIQALVTDRGFDLNTRVFPYLGITTVALASQTKDPRIDNVTVRHLVDHTGGWVRSVSGLDPVFAGRRFAVELGLPSHVMKRDVARYMYGEPLQYNPGDSMTFDGGQRYSNFGYLLLGLVVERATNLSFIDYLRQRVINDIHLGATLRSGRLAGEVSYDAPWVGNSAWSPYSTALVPGAYGNFLIAEMDSGGGLVASAPAVSAFINQNAVWGMGGRAPGSARSGGMAGTASLAVSRWDGIDWAYIFNSADVAAGSLDTLYNDLTNAITAAGF